MQRTTERRGRTAPADMVTARVRAYMTALPPANRAKLRRMRDAIRVAAPGAVEHFSYGMPGFRLDDRPLVWYAAFKDHSSLFPMTDAIRRANAKAIAGYETSKGTIRFPWDKQPSAALVRRLVKSRIADLRSGGR